MKTSKGEATACCPKCGNTKISTGIDWSVDKFVIINICYECGWVKETHSDKPTNSGTSFDEVIVDEAKFLNEDNNE